MKKVFIGFALTALLSALSLTMVVAQTATPAPTATPVGTSCPGAPAPRLSVGETAQVAQAFSSLRADVGSPVVLRVMYRANNDQFTVTAGPVCAGPHYWYEVDFNGITGWVTEGLGATYWIEPAGETTPPITVTVVTATPVATATLPAETPMPTTGCPGAPEPRLTVGGQAGVAQVFSTLRADVGSNTALTIMYRANNDTFTVVSGPVCSGPYYWWEVTFNGMTGWVTEGTGATYWVEPLASTASTGTTEESIEAEATPESEG